MSININKKLINERRPKTINKNFNDFRNELLNYAKSNFKDQISDFSESSLGGMLLDFAAIVGESMSFYTEQQLNELDYTTASNPDNINKHLLKAGITKNSVSPSIAEVLFTIETSIDEEKFLLTGSIEPDYRTLPIIKKDTQLASNNNINFILQEDVDFSKDATITTGIIDDNGNPITVFLTKKGICSSGNIVLEIANFNLTVDGFINYTLQNEDVTEIISVFDNEGNEYYEVEHLSQDTVYKKISNAKQDYYQVVIAPFRYKIEQDFLTKFTTLRFGNGERKTLLDNILINPDEISLPIMSRNYVTSHSLDPRKLLITNSLGVSPATKLLTIKYRYGGGISHNVQKNTINQIKNISIIFPKIHEYSEVVDTENIKNIIINTLSVNNEDDAIGGANELSIEELRSLIPAYLKMQSRVINNEDLLARIYTMPSNFGRINKAVIANNKFNSNTRDLFVVCKDNTGSYIHASDSIKINLKNYLNTLRIVGDELNIVDVPIINIGVDAMIKIKEGYNIKSVLDKTLYAIARNYRFENLQIGEAINTNEIIKIILSVEGVANIVTDQKSLITNKTQSNNFFSEELNKEIQYSNILFSVKDSYEDGYIYPPNGGLFELKFSMFDIVVRNN